MDRSSTQWLYFRWVAAGKPVMPRLEWDSLVEKVGAMTERDVLHV